MVVTAAKPKFNPLPGTAMVTERRPGVWFCQFHSQEFETPEWIVWENDYHAACPSCFLQEMSGGIARAIPSDEYEDPDPEPKVRVIPINKIVTCHNGECGLQTYATEQCKICKYAFCHRHLIKFREIRVCRECEANTVRETGCQHGACTADAESWCEVCKKRTCHFHLSSRLDHLCQECGGEVSS